MIVAGLPQNGGLMRSRFRTGFRRTGLSVAMLILSAALSARPVSTVAMDGQTYLNDGLVGVGRLPADLRDKFGETFGSLSAMCFQPGTWRRNPDGSYSGTLLTQPDRGYNRASTTNYVSRYNRLAVRFTPGPADAPGRGRLRLRLADTTPYSGPAGRPLTSLDPTIAGAGFRPGFPPLPQAYNHRISLDAEGLVANRDGTLWVSDEYGPYIYRFSAAGRLLEAIRPPEAFIPRRGGVVSFSADSPGIGQPAPSPRQPVTGRQNNQGFEGLSLAPDGRMLFALMQSALRQDGGDGGRSATRRYTRLLAYNVTGTRPVLRGEYVLALPLYRSHGPLRVAAQSEMLALGETRFLVLAHDGDRGHTLPRPKSVYRWILLYDLGRATNIAGTAYDTSAHPVAPHGKLAAGVVPATGARFIDLNNSAQLAEFGLHNGRPDDGDNLAEKWEALALAPALDPAAPRDWFLFVGNDNDFITTHGFQDGRAYDAGADNDTMILVFRVTLPAPAD